MNPYEVDIDIKNKKAEMVIPYLTYNIDNEDDRVKVITAASVMRDVIVSIDNNEILLSIRFDFGKFIPKNIWKMFDNPLLSGYPREQEYYTKLAVLESVKILYPKVLESFKDIYDKKFLKEGE